MRTPLDGTAPKLAPGDTLGDVYKIVRVISERRNGVVVEAEQTRLNRRVVIKTLGARVSSDRGAQARLAREAEQVSKLHHPHIVQVLDFNQTDFGVPYLVMEYVEGESLESALRRKPEFALAVALKIGAHIASALAAAHAASIAHRSLSPRHIILSGAPDEPFARVLGFGISLRNGRSKSGELALDPDEEILAYLAPEQRKPGGPVTDELSDQYSAAAILHQMLTGTLPEVKGGGVRALFRRRVSVEAPSKHRSSIPPALDRVVVRALAQEPSERYPKMSEFAAALLEAGRGFLRRSSTAPSRASSVSAPRKSVTPRPTQRPIEPTAAPRTGMTPPNSLHTPKTVSLSAEAEKPRTPSLRPSVRAPENEAEKAFEGYLRAARSHKDGALDPAVDAVLLALALADNSTSALIERRAADSNHLFEEVLSRCLGAPESILELTKAWQGDAGLSPTRAFLLSRIDGSTTFGELLSLSPLPHLQTMRHLCELVRAGAVRTR